MRTLAALLLIATLAPAQVFTGDDAKRNTLVSVVTSDGKPAPGLTIAGLWGAGGYMAKEDRTRMVPVDPTWKTGKDGTVKIPLRTRSGPYASGGKIAALMVYDESQENAALAVVPTDVEKVVLKLAPVVTVSGKFACEELGRPPRWANSYLFGFTEDGRENVRVAVAATPDAAFSLKLPPGRYVQHCFGEEVALLRRDLELEADRPKEDLGTIDLEASAIAKAYGKEPPYWWIREARGVSEDVLPGDFRGKWLLVIYWAWW